MVSRAIAILLALGLSVSAEASTASERAEARRAFRRAQKLFKQERYEAAYPFYRKAYELSGKRPSTIFGLAQCERLLGHYDDSIEHFLEYLAAHPDAPNAERVRETIALLDRARRKDAENERARESSSEDAQEDRPSTDPAEKGAAAPPAQLSVSSTPPPSPTPEVLQSARPPPEDSGSFWTSPTFLIIAGAVVAAGTGVALGFALSKEGDPYPGNTGVLLNNLEAR